MRIPRRTRPPYWRWIAGACALEGVLVHDELQIAVFRWRAVLGFDELILYTGVEDLVPDMILKHRVEALSQLGFEGELHRKYGPTSAKSVILIWLWLSVASPAV